jgi:hypothetical protein
MVAWLPALKVSLPYITQIVTAAIPMFTSKPKNADSAALVPQQIEELQVAVVENAENVKGLATQMQNNLESLSSGASDLQREMRLIKRLIVLALTLAIIGLSLAVWMVISK